MHEPVPPIKIPKYLYAVILSFKIKELKIKTIKAVLYKKQNTGGGFIFKYLD